MKSADYIRQRDEVCIYCNNDLIAELDHVIPKSLRGPTAKWNLVGSCKPCNIQKRNKLDGRYLIKAYAHLIRVEDDQSWIDFLALRFGPEFMRSIIEEISLEKKSILENKMVQELNSRLEIEEAKSSVEPEISEPMEENGPIYQSHQFFSHCEECGSQFPKLRRTKRFCSSKCQMDNWMKLNPRIEHLLKKLRDIKSGE